MRYSRDQLVKLVACANFVVDVASGAAENQMLNILASCEKPGARGSSKAGGFEFDLNRCALWGLLISEYINGKIRVASIQFRHVLRESSLVQSGVFDLVLVEAFLNALREGVVRPYVLPGEISYFLHAMVEVSENALAVPP